MLRQSSVLWGLPVLAAVQLAACQPSPSGAERAHAPQSPSRPTNTLPPLGDRVPLIDASQDAGPADVAVCTGRLSTRRLFHQHAEAQLCVFDTAERRDIELRYPNQAPKVISDVMVRKGRSDDLLHYEISFNQAGLDFWIQDGGQRSTRLTTELWMVPRFSTRSEGALSQHFIGRAVQRFVPVGARDEAPPHLYDGLHFYSADNDHAPHWGYAGDTGPDHWGDLAPGSEACSLERDQTQQSPIVLDPREMMGCASHGDIEGFAYHAGHATLLNNGHTVMASFVSNQDLAHRQAGSHFVADGKRFGLLQMHLHVPAEHVFLDSHGRPRRMDGEMHLVHQAADGEIAVIGVGVVAWEPNTEHPEGLLRDMLLEFPELRNEPVEFSRMIDPNVILRSVSAGAHFGYMGSLTTPPCTEGVRWFVYEEPARMDRESLDRAAKLIGGPNARRASGPAHSVPPVGERVVMRCGGE